MQTNRQLPLSDGYKYLLVTVCFHTGLKPSLADRLLPLLWLKSSWERFSLSGELLLNFRVIEEHSLLARRFDKYVLFGRIYTVIVLTSLSLLA